MDLLWMSLLRTCTIYHVIPSRINYIFKFLLPTRNHRRKEKVSSIFFLAAGCSLLSIFNITIRINNLLVDFILPTMCLASIAIIYTYRNDLKKHGF